MKKFTFTSVLLLLLLMISTGFSQTIEMRRVGGSQIVDNQVVGFSSNVEPASELYFKVKNAGVASTKVRTACVSLNNTDGSDMQFCFAHRCANSIVAGNVYFTPVTLAPGAENTDHSHFLYTGLLTGTFPKDYKMRFYQINDAGVEVGNSISVTYRFDPSLSIDEMGQLKEYGIIIKSTVVTNQLDLDVLKSSKMNIYDLSGKLILDKKLDYGIHSVDVSAFTSGIYVIKFIDESGNISTKRIVKN